MSNIVEFLTGEPERNGQYVCYVRDRTQPEWLRPILLQWHYTKWYFPRSDKTYQELVYGWSGPLPVGKLSDPVPPVLQEYDL